LNYAKIKHFLLNSDEEIKVCATLQALRWRLTKTKRKQIVRQIIYTYMHYDLLGCMSSGKPDESMDQSSPFILEHLLKGSR